MSLLTESEFRDTFGDSMKQAEASGNSPFPFWGYVDGIPNEDFGGYDCSEGIVRWVWKDEKDQFEHVLIDTREDTEVFMVIVLDLQRRQVAGHRLLDLKQEYGHR